MKLRRVRAVARKEFLHVLRDPRSLVMGLAIPMLLLFMFGYALTLDVDRVPLIVRDLSGTPESRDFVARFTASRYFTLAGSSDSYQRIEEAIDRREALMGLTVPAGFARDLKANRPVAVQLLVDGSDANTATIALGYADGIFAAYAREVRLEQLQRLSGRTLRFPLEVEPRVWFNADMLSRNAIVPGLIAVIMMVIAALLTSLTVAREWETGTMEQLIATPVTGGELILGKLIPYFCIGVFDLVVALLVGRFAFAVPLRGSLVELFLLALLFLLGALGLGILISIVGRSQFVASQFAMVATLLPAFLLSGFVFAIESMPGPLQVLTQVIPARYFIAILRAIYLKGVGVTVLWREALFLAVFGVLFLMLAVRRFRKKIG